MDHIGSCERQVLIKLSGRQLLNCACIGSELCLIKLGVECVRDSTYLADSLVTATHLKITLIVRKREFIIRNQMVQS